MEEARIPDLEALIESFPDEENKRLLRRYLQELRWKARLMEQNLVMIEQTGQILQDIHTIGRLMPCMNCGAVPQDYYEQDAPLDAHLPIYQPEGDVDDGLLLPEDQPADDGLYGLMLPHHHHHRHHQPADDDLLLPDHEDEETDDFESGIEEGSDTDTASVDVEY